MDIQNRTKKKFNTDFWIRTVVYVCAFVSAFIGLFVLLGWAFGFNDVSSLGKKFVPMAEESAVLFLITGIALLLLLQKTKTKMSRSFLFGSAILIGAVALLTLIDVVTAYRWNLSDILGSTNVIKAGIITGKMSWTSAVCFIFVSIALLLLPTKLKRYSVLFSSFSLFIGYIIVVGYSYGVPLLYGGTSIPMAWPTAIAFIFASTGLLFVAGQETAPMSYFMGDSTRARLLRNILPLIFLTMVLQDFFDAFTNKAYSTINSVTNSTVDIIILIIVGIIISSKSKSIGNSIDKNIFERKQAEEALRDSKEQLRNFASNLQLVREDERTKLAREIHDSLSQYLVALKLDIGLLKKKLLKEDQTVTAEELISEMDKLIVQVENANKSARMIMNGLRPEQLELLGFVTAAETHINDFMETHHIQCVLINEIHSLNIEQESALALFRILQESFNNILKHAMANLITVKFANTNGNLEMEIVDNGIGFNANNKGRADAYGIIGMKERVNLLNGNFEITSNVGEGTRVRVEIPFYCNQN